MKKREWVLLPYVLRENVKKESGIAKIGNSLELLKSPLAKWNQVGKK
jgi:hypothetical protein